MDRSNFLYYINKNKKKNKKAKQNKTKNQKTTKRKNQILKKMEKTICSTKTNSPTTTIATGTPTKKIVNEQVTPHRCFNGAYKQ